METGGVTGELSILCWISKKYNQSAVLNQSNPVVKDTDFLRLFESGRSPRSTI